MTFRTRTLLGGKQSCEMCIPKLVFGNVDIGFSYVLFLAFLYERVVLLVGDYLQNVVDLFLGEFPFNLCHTHRSYALWKKLLRGDRFHRNGMVPRRNFLPL